MGFITKIVNRLRKLFNCFKRSEQKLTIDVLNDDCIERVIKNLPFNEILRLEKVNKRFELCVKEVLKQQKVLCIGYAMYCKHPITNSQFFISETVINLKQMKALLIKCPNIECLQMSEILINKSLIKWISNNCKKLVCIHLDRPIFNSKTPEIDFKQIGNLLSDKLEIEINFRSYKEIREDSIIALIENMPQIKDVGIENRFAHSLNLERIVSFGHIRSFCSHDLTINDLNVLKNNINLVELRLHSCSDCAQHKFDFICDNFTQLKSLSFCFRVWISISISKLIKLTKLKDLELRAFKIDSFLMNQNNCFNKTLKSLSLRVQELTTTLYEGLFQMFPNVEKISCDFSRFECEHLIRCHDCSQCNDQVIKCLSKLNRLKVLEIVDFSCVKLNDILRIFDKYGSELLNPKDLYPESILIDLIQSLALFCYTNPKLLCTLWIHEIYFNLITEKKTINGFEYNVFFDCEKFDKNYGKKFDIPKNMRIIGFNITLEYYIKNFTFNRRVFI
jgi:hypothetical protein